MSLTVPEPGQLVDVRHRQFVVTEVQKSALPPDVLHPDEDGAQDLVTLSSVEYDGAVVIEEASIDERT